MESEEKPACEYKIETSEKKKRSWTKLELAQSEMSYFQDCCVKRKALESDAFDRSTYFASNLQGV